MTSTNPFMAPLTAGEARRQLREAECELQAAREFGDVEWAAEAQNQLEFYQSLVTRLEAEGQVVHCGRCGTRCQAQPEKSSRCCDRCFTELFKSTRLAPLSITLEESRERSRRRRPDLSELA
jgi:NADH pyrophosphatase NudC (nudix superfamily)